jgi:hypothetical protein
MARVAETTFSDFLPTVESDYSVAKKRTVATSGGSAIDLTTLGKMHPRLPGELVLLLQLRAALGLQRNGHVSGVDLQAVVSSASQSFVLTWPAADDNSADQHDSKRITEDGAEAIALAVAHFAKSWRVVRRLQQEEFADWLLEYKDDGVRKLVAFEVSGTDKGIIDGRMREKLAQVAKSKDVNQRWAGIVGFKRPETTLKSTRRRRDDR